MISGFSDEISNDFDEQLKSVAQIGMEYISLRGVDGKNIGEHTLEEIKESILPRLKKAGIKVSSIGSPIGKVEVSDEEGFEKQKKVLETLCRACNELGCSYIRVFSFYIPEGEDPNRYKKTVIRKIKEFAEIAEKHHVVLLHENEKDIFGDTAARCKDLFDEVDSLAFRGIFDFANFVQCGEDTKECYDILRDYIDYIHIKDAVYTDSENVLCGTGDGKIPELLAEFINSGYKGFLTLEPHLVLFDSLKDLEIKDAQDVIKAKSDMTNYEGFKLQHDTLIEILNDIL
jgi:sugar phosphate isomerase/epimerase